jgi:hypothetical protein
MVMTYLACTPEAKSQTGAGARASGRRRSRRVAVFLLVAVAVALAACQFSPGSLDGPGGPGDPPPDADPSAPDASENPTDGGPGENCGWPFAPEHFDPCLPFNPTGLAPLVLGGGGTYSYNTDTELFLDPNGEDVVPKPPDTLEQGGEVRALWVNGLTIQLGTALRVEGSLPLMIVSTAEIQVSGILDVSSTWDPVSLTYDPGAGADDALPAPSDECSNSTGGTGGDCGDGGAGGGGGGFGGAGADGGRGGGSRNCGDVEGGSPGGAGGNAVAPPSTIRGGCKGARGGNGDIDMLYGLGGFGGGAVHLVSMVRIDIEGRIQAGGAAGSGAENNRSGGGGGGSGGLIGLEALDIEIGGILAANGGGGGGGCNNGLADSGEDGQTADQAAIGGAGQSTGGGGGNGGFSIERDGLPGTAADRGGGGGGGGAGFIVTYRAEPTVAGSAVISPELTER